MYGSKPDSDNHSRTTGVEDGSYIARRFRFGVFEVDPAAGELRKQGVKVKLQGKPFQLLVTLLEQAEKITTREELRSRLWAADTFVDFDANLKTSMNKLRRALGDSADNPIFIETIPRQGYRFLSPVVTVPTTAVDDKTSPSPDELNQTPMSSPAAITVSPLRKPFLIALGLLGIAAAAALMVFLLRPPTKPLASPGRVVLVVLPFANLSGDPGQEYFSDGLTDEMITLLGSQYPEDLSVIARTSSMRYKGARGPLHQITRELGSVQYALEGSVRRSGNHVAINAQLVRTQDEATLWAQSYENEVTDVLAIQNDVARQIAGALVLKLVPLRPATQPSSSGQNAPNQKTINPKVYDAYLWGLYEANKRTAESLQKSVANYYQAVNLDPGYAPAYAGIADSDLISAGWLTLKPSVAYPRAKQAALRALELDDNLAEAHATLAEVEHEYEWKWAEPEREFRRAIHLNPNSLLAHKSYAEFLMHAGKYAEAIAQIERARDLDPLSLSINSLVCFIYSSAGRHDRAIENCQRAIQLDPQFAPGHYFLGAALIRQRRYEEAIGEFQTARGLSKDASMMEVGLARAYAVAGRHEEASITLQELERKAKRHYVSPYGLAQVYAVLGNRRHALEGLDRAAAEHSFELVFLKTDCSFAGIRDTPGFQALIRKIGFPSGPSAIAGNAKAEASTTDGCLAQAGSSL